jgi:hypothetical protein
MPYFTESARTVIPSVTDPAYTLERIYELNTPARLIAEQQAAIKAQEDAKRRAQLEATGLETLFPSRLAAATRKVDADMANIIRGYQDQVNKIDDQISGLVSQQDQFRSIDNPSKREQLDRQIEELQIRKNNLKERTRTLLDADREIRPETGSGVRPQGFGLMDPRFTTPPDALLSNKASSIVDSALDAGQQIARDQNRVTNETFLPRAREQEDSGFFGSPQTMDFVKRILQIMARPEFQDPEGIAAGVAGAAYGIKQDELKAQKVQREEQRLANEAAQLQFLNQLRIAEARRGERSLQLREQEAAKPKSTALPTDKEFSKGVIDLVKRMGKNYLDKESKILGPSKTDIAREIAAEARSLVSRSGGTISIREAVEEILAIRQGKVPSSTNAQVTNRYQVVKEK